MRLFSYVITHDAGFAPNPFGGFLTLATCKPKIRLSAKKGDLIVGTGSAKTVGKDRLVYVGLVSSVVPLEQYGSLPRYAVKIPTIRAAWWRKHGDNIYVKVEGTWTQRRNLYHFQRDIARDVSGANVLICNQFWYFGGSAIELPQEFHDIVKKGPGHKIINDASVVDAFLEWLTANFPKGRHRKPQMSPESSTDADNARSKSCKIC